MDQKIKSKWVRALRSGKFKQGDGKLYHKRTYCCLGVLARVQGAVPHKGVLKLAGKDVRKNADDQDAREEFLARRYAAGLHGNTQSRLSKMNDGSGKYYVYRQTFEQIADYIDKRL